MAEGVWGRIAPVTGSGGTGGVEAPCQGPSVNLLTVNSIYNKKNVENILTWGLVHYNFGFDLTT